MSARKPLIPTRAHLNSPNTKREYLTSNKDAPNSIPHTHGPTARSGSRSRPIHPRSYMRFSCAYRFLLSAHGWTR